MLVFHHGEHIALAHHEILLTLVLELRAGILTVEHHIALLKHHGLVLGTLANGNDLATLGFLFGGVGNDDSTYFLFSWCGLYQHSVC